MVGIMARLGARGRHGGANAIVHLAREVVGRRRTLASGLQEVRNPGVLDALADEDFRVLDTTISERTQSDRDFALTLARLSHAAAKAKGFDRCVVDAALRLDTLLATDDPERERDKLLRDAYGAAQRASYIRGGRLALGRLGRRAVENGDIERARVLLQQQLDLGPEKDDTTAEVDSALVLGDILRREGDADAAQTSYRRASQAAQRLDYHQGVAEGLMRQIDVTPADHLDTVAALQRQALDAAQRTGDLVLEGRILIGLAETLAASGRLEDATKQFNEGLRLARETNDLALEARCVTALASAYRQLDNGPKTVEAVRSALAIEERLGNRQAAATWAVQLGSLELDLGQPEAAADAFDRAQLLASQIGDPAMEQRAEGGLGVAYTLMRHPSDAIDHLSRALSLARSAGDVTRQAHWYASLSQAFWTFGQLEDATRTTTQAIDAARAAQDVALEAELFTLLGQVYAARRETIRARDCFTHALQLNRDLNQTTEQVTTLTALAALAAETGQYTQASNLFDQALSLATTSGDHATAARLHGRIGRLAQKRGDIRAALGQFTQAYDQARGIGDPRLESQALQHLATAQDVANDSAAAQTYERAIAAADAAGDHRGAVTMRLNLGARLALKGDGRPDDGIAYLQDAADLAYEYGPAYRDLADRADDLLRSVAPAAPAGATYGGSNGYRTDYHDERSAMFEDRSWRDDAAAPSAGSERYGDPAYEADAYEWDDPDGYAEHVSANGYGAEGSAYGADARWERDEPLAAGGYGHHDADDAYRDYAAPDDRRAQWTEEADHGPASYDEYAPWQDPAGSGRHEPYAAPSSGPWDEDQGAYQGDRYTADGYALSGGDQPGGTGYGQWGDEPYDDEPDPGELSYPPDAYQDPYGDEPAEQGRYDARPGDPPSNARAGAGRHVRNAGREIYERPAEVPEWWRNSKMNQSRQSNGRRPFDDELLDEMSLPMD